MRKRKPYPGTYKPEPLDLSAAKKRLIYWLSKRDYTAYEITKKMKLVASDEVTAQVLEWCEDYKLLIPEEQMREVVVQKHRRMKSGRVKLNQDLAKRGLGPMTDELEYELDAAHALVEKKMATLERKTPFSEMSTQERMAAKAKVFRFLAGRGFSMELLSKAFSAWTQAQKTE